MIYLHDRSGGPELKEEGLSLPETIMDVRTPDVRPKYILTGVPISRTVANLG